jgi:signal transduction histidine kinase
MPRLRLEYRLPLLVSGIFALLALAGTWLAYQEVRGAALSSAEDRIRALIDELGPSVETALEQRTRLLEHVAMQPVVRVAADANAGFDTDSLTQTLLLLRRADDPVFVVAVLRTDGSAIRIGDDVPVQTPPLAAFLGFAGTEGPRYTRLFEHAGRVYYWTAVPIPDSGESAAFIAQLRRVTGTPRILEDLAGPDAAIYLLNPDSDRWFALGEPPAEAPQRLRRDADRIVYERAGRAFLARISHLPGTPWHLVLELPQDVAFSRAHLFVRRVIGVGVLLTLLGVGASVTVMRRMLRPVGELAAAARGIATGEYDRRVPVRDGDEIAELANAFNAMAAQVELAVSEAQHNQLQADEASRAKSAFLATMSHELRTPINAVIGYTELLDIGVAGELSAQQRHYVDRIRTSSGHLTRLVDELLDIAKIETGQLRVVPRVCSAADHVAAACDVILAQAKLRKVRLDAETTDITFIGDPQRVEQILVNLLSNAVKFSESGGVVEVRCRAAEPRSAGGARMCRFDVTDHGCGIPLEMHEAIFEPFVQVDGSYTRSRGGAGLGLSISRELARLMGGSITVCSTVGVGSTFTLWLPLAPAPVSRRAAGHPTEDGRAAGPTASGLTLRPPPP